MTSVGTTSPVVRLRRDLPPVGDVEDGQTTILERDENGLLMVPPKPYVPLLKRVTGAIEKLVVPDNYPRSVTKDYLPSREWAFVHDTATAITNFYASAGLATALSLVPSFAEGAGLITFNLIRDTIVQGLSLPIASLAPFAARKARAWGLGSDIAEKLGSMGDTGASAVVHATAPMLGFGGVLGLATADGLLRVFAGQMKSAATADVNLTQETGDALASIGARNSGQSAVATLIGNGAALLSQPYMAHSFGAATAAILMTGVSALVAVYAQGRYMGSLAYAPVNEEVIREAVLQGKAPAPRQASWAALPSIFKRDQAPVGRSIIELVERDPARVDVLQDLYKDRDYMLEWADGKPIIVMRAARLSDGKPTGPEDQVVAVMQAIHAETLSISDEYANIEQQHGRLAADEWVVQESLKATPKDAAGPLLKELKDAGFFTQFLRIQDRMHRATWMTPADAGPANVKSFTLAPRLETEAQWKRYLASSVPAEEKLQNLLYRLADDPQQKTVTQLCVLHNQLQAGGLQHWFSMGGKDQLASTLDALHRVHADKTAEIVSQAAASDNPSAYDEALANSSESLVERALAHYQKHLLRDAAGPNSSTV